jgi:hypothetical protein
MVRRRNPSVIEFSSDSDKIQEESFIPSPPPCRSLSKRGRGSGRMDGEGSSMPSLPTHGRRQKVGASRPRRSTSSSGYAPCQEEDGAFDDFIDLPASDALYVTGLHMHPANVTRGPHEPPVDFSLKGIDTLQRLRFTNPTLTPRHPGVQDPRFWNLFQADFYNSVILSKKHPVVRHRFIDWEGCENMGDTDMTSALQNLERKGLQNIMTMEYPWNDEVVAQFYATLWIKEVDEEADGYDYPVMYFFIKGNWHKVSYRRFAHILGFSDADILGSNM